MYKCNTHIINYYVEYGARNCFPVGTWPQGQGQLDRIRCPGRMSMSSLAITSSLTWWPIHIESTRLESHGCVNDMSTSPRPLKLPLIARRCKEQSSAVLKSQIASSFFCIFFSFFWCGQANEFFTYQGVQFKVPLAAMMLHWLWQLSMWSQVGLLQTFKLRKCQMVKCNCAT
jgi:hypothetical protein